MSSKYDKALAERWSRSMSNKNDKALAAGSTMVYSGAKQCKGSHTGAAPIQVGGYPLYLGARCDIKAEVLKGKHIILPLNGDMPLETWYGQYLPILSCKLADHGGVPENWAEFIKTMCQEIVKGKHILAYCTGSHGRTGCFAASVLAIMEPDCTDPIAAIRERHCKEAVESLAQAEAIFKLKGQELPAEYVAEFKSHFSGSCGGSSYDAKTNPYYHHLPCNCGKCRQKAWQPKFCLCSMAKCKETRSCILPGCEKECTPLMGRICNFCWGDPAKKALGMALRAVELEASPKKTAKSIAAIEAEVKAQPAAMGGICTACGGNLRKSGFCDFCKNWEPRVCANCHTSTCDCSCKGHKAIACACHKPSGGPTVGNFDPSSKCPNCQVPMALVTSSKDGKAPATWHKCFACSFSSQAGPSIN